MVKTKVKDWEKEFDKHFQYIQDATNNYFEVNFGGSPDGKDLEKIKAFISKLLKKERELVISEIEKKIEFSEWEKGKWIKAGVWIYKKEWNKFKKKLINV